MEYVTRYELKEDTMTSVGQQGANTRPQGKHSGASQQVLEYLRQNPNLAISYPEIQKAINAVHTYTVANAVQHLTTKGLPLEKPMKGVVMYRTMPRALPGPELSAVLEPGREIFEQVGTSHGHVIVRGEDGELFVITPLWGTE